MKNKLLIIIAAAGMILFFRPLLVMALLVVIGACSTFYKRYVNIGFDFELCTIGAIVAGVVYSPLAGFLVGFISMLLGLILNLLFFKNIFFAFMKTTAIALIGACAAFVPEQFLVAYGALMVLLSDVVFCSVAAYAGGNKGKLAMVALTHTMMVYAVARVALLPLIRVVG